jgi:predicted kinase
VPIPLELVIFVGLQASGKTTFFKQRFAGSHAHVSKDNFRHNRKPDRRQAQLITQALVAGTSVVVDNTNPTRADREAAIALARALGARVVAYYFDASPEDCLARNREREGRQLVPERGVQATLARLTPPAAEEGYDAIYTVKIEPDMAFTVTLSWKQSELPDHTPAAPSPF